jgi:L-threonylcarbamoyladenylate synthase
MRTRIIFASSPETISKAEKEIKQGKLIAFPTDTVYGLAADLNDSNAIEKVFIAKGRDFNKAIAVLISDLNQIEILTNNFNDQALTLANHFWPGALTIIVAKRSNLPENLSPTPTLGIRMPDHVFALKLLHATGPLATTSANLSGMANPLTAQDVMDQLHDRVDLIIDGGRCPGGTPSTVVDCTNAEPVILRQGIITADEIRKTLQR